MGNFIKKNRVILILLLVAIIAFAIIRVNQSRNADSGSQFQTVSNHVYSEQE